MVRRNVIPRRLIGARGIRLYDIQGLVYPTEMLRDEPVEKVVAAAPEWGISSVEAAAILGCTSSSARFKLNKFGVEKVKVSRVGKPPIYYWHREQVEALAAAQRREVRQVSERFMDAHEVGLFLGISRSTIYRYVQSGVLTAHPVRHRTDTGIRLKHFFMRDDVRRLRYHLNALRCRFNKDKK